MAEITSSSTPDGAKQESADAQTLDELTSLQQQNPTGLAAETTDVTVTTGDPTKQDDPSLVTATNVQYGGTALPEGSAPSPTALSPVGANVPTTEQATALNQNVQEVTAEQLTTPAPMELGTATAELEGVPATPERLDQTAPFVPSGFSDPSEVVVIQEDQTVIGNLLAGTTSPDGVITITTFEVNGTTYTAGQSASLEGIGSISITSSGTYTFTPESNWNGVLPEVAYNMTDGYSVDTSTLNITVNPLNDPATITSQAEGLTETDVVLSTSGQLLITDVDVGQAQVVPQTAVSGQYGDFNISADGSWTYVTHTPYNELPAGEQLSESFTVSSEDGTAIGSVAITITGTNDVAAVSSQSMSLLETNTVLSTSGVLNITDVDTGEAHVVAQTGISGLYGQFNIEEGGAWTYVTNSAYDELPAGAQITETFSVSSHDGTGFGSVTVTVTGTNDVAVLSSESQTLEEGDEALQTSGALSISDVDAGEAFVNPRSDVSGAYGTFNIDANGAWTYEAYSAFNELNAGDQITDQFTVTSVDGTATNTVTVTIIGTNDLATVTSAAVTLDETDVALSTGGALQISDLDEGEAHVLPQTDVPGLHGIFNINADGEWTYTANSAFNELNAGDQITDQFTVTSVDGTASNLVTVTIIGTNDFATVSSATVSLDETDTALSTGGSLQIDDLDENEAHVTAQTNVPGLHGIFNINADGEWTYTANSAFNELNAGDQITDQFTVTSVDGTASNLVTVTIIGTNDLATVSSATVTLDETDTALTTGGSLQIGDLDENEAHVTAQTNVPGLHGIFNINADGEWTYTANSEFNELNAGDQITDQFTVTSVDGTASNTITVTIIGTNDLATVSSATVTLDEINEPLTTGGSLVIGDLDEGEAHVQPQSLVSGAHGVFSIDANGVWTYEAKSAFNELNAGDQITDQFTVTSVDGTASNTVTVTIIGTNDLATVSSATVTLDETDTALSTGGSLQIGDLDENEAHVTPQNNVLGLHGTFNINADGEWTYIANSAFNELNAGDQITDQFTVTSVDGTASNTVTVTIIGTNDLATVSSATVTLDETDTALSTGGSLQIGDLDENEAHVTPQTNTLGTYGVFSINADGQWTYVANSAFNELNAGDVISDQFAVTSVDGTATNTVTISIVGTNDQATVSSATVVLNETNEVLSTGGTLQITDLDEGEAHVVAQSNVDGSWGTFSIDANGVWTYIAHSDYNELNANDQLGESFTVTSQDGTAIGTISVSIIGTNDIATLSSAAVTLNETNDALSTGGHLIVEDIDENEAHVRPMTNVDGLHGHFSIDSDGNWTYQADAAFNELNQGDQITDQFTVTSQDGTATNTVTVTILGTNDQASLSYAAVTLDETDSPLSIGGSLVVADPDEGEAHVVPQTNVPGTYGTFSIDADGIWSYHANSAYNELNAGDQISDTFQVTSQDGTAINTVQVTIIGTNDEAIVSSEEKILSETNDALMANGDLSITDLDDQEAKVVARSNVDGLHGTFNIDANGVWTYVADSAFNELNLGDTISDSFTVKSVDGTGTGTVTITIVGTNDLATVSSSVIQLNEQDVVLNAGGTLSIGDLDEGEAHVDPVLGLHGLHGTFSMSADGVWTYVTDSAFNELNAGDQISDTFTINSVDGTASGTVQIIITGTNDLATVSSETIILNETNAPLSTGGTLTAFDLDEGEAHVEAQTNIAGEHGVFSIDEQGAWTYVANSAFDELLAGQEITDHFDVTSHDGTGLGVVTVTIIGTSDHPVIGSLQVTASEITHDETVGIQSVGGANDSSAAIASAFSVITDTPMGMAEIANAAVLSGVADYRPSTGGSLEITGYQLTNADKAGFTGEATNLQVTGGDQIHLYTEGDLIVGREIGTNNVAFAVYIDDAGTVQLVQYLAIDHGEGSGTEDATQGANELRNLLIGSNSPIYVTEFVTATNAFGESSDFEIRSNNALNIGFLDDGPSVDFANVVAPVNENNLYTGTWTFQSGVDTQTGIQDLMNTLTVNAVSVSGEPVTFSSLGSPELVDGKLVYNGTFDFDTDPDPLVTANKTVNYTLTLEEQSPGQYQYTLDLDKAIQNVIINDSEFSGSVHAGGPTPVYDLAYTDTTTQDTLTAQVTVQSGAALTQNVIGTSTTINPIFVGSALNASSNGIGIDTPNLDSSIIKGAKGQPDVYTVEGMNFNPEGETSQVTIGFKGSGSPSWGSTDVLHVTIHGVAVDTLAPINQQLVLTGMGSVSSPIAGTIHVPAGSASYTINLPEGMAYIESVDVSAGFGSDARGNIVPTVANITFGFATITSVEIADLPIQFEFQAAVTDADGDLAYDSFNIETMTGSILAGSAGADDLNGTLLADNIAGGGGIDDISGDAGADFLIGGAEGDVISGGDGADTIYGDADITSSAAYAGNDTISGDAGADIIHGDGGADTIMGGSGEDIIHGDSGNDTISGGTENDTLYGDSGNDVIAGDAGNDIISGGEGDDVISGGAGDDILQGNAGSDILTGGTGNDTFVLTDDGGIDTIIDFQPGDQIDLSDILPNAPEIDPAQFQDYVQIIDDGDSGAVSLWIDADGSGTEESWEHIAELENIDPATVTLHFDPTTDTIDFTQDPGDWDVSESAISPEDLINSGRK